MACLQASIAMAVAASLLVVPAMAVRFQVAPISAHMDVPGPVPPRGFVGYIAGPCIYRNASLTGCCGWLLDGSSGGSNISLYGDAVGEGANSRHCTGDNPAFASYNATVQSYKCISATEGVLLSKPIPATADSAFFCNRYRIVDGGAKVKVVAAVKLGSYPECPDAVVDKAHLDIAPALVSSAGTYNVIGETQLPLCA